MTGSQFAPVAFGLASAACWGAGDFCGGLATKRTHVYSVVIASQLVGVMMLIGLACAFAEKMPLPKHLLWGGMGGLAGTVGLIALYRALAMGRMGVVAPVAGVIGAAVPVILGALLEGWPGPLQLIGFMLALIAVWFVSRAEDTTLRVRDLELATVAGLCFGVFFTFIHRASETAVLWPLVAARIVSLSMMFVVATVARQPRLPEVTHLPLVTLVGVMEVGGNTFYALAAHTGRLDVAAVISSLYPAATVWLAWLILKERATRVQTVGIVAALAAIVLIAS